MRKILLMFFLMLTGIVKAEDNISTIVEKIQRTYEGIKDFKADFLQESTNRALKYTITDTGIVYFKKPGKMRWDYIKNMDNKSILLQQIVNDGEKLYFYNPSDNQVLVEDIKTVVPSRAPNNFLAGMGNIKRDFEVVENYYKLTKKDPNLYYFELKPKEQIKGVSRIFIAVDREKFLVRETIILDQFENTTKITFSNIEKNKLIPDDVFKFQMPKGASVITPKDK